MGRFSTTEAQFMKHIVSAGVPLGRVQIIPEWFSEALDQNTREKHQLGQAAIVHLDSDLFESVTAALDFVSPLVVAGSVIIFCDCFCFKGNPDHGE